MAGKLRVAIQDVNFDFHGGLPAQVTPANTSMKIARNRKPLLGTAPDSNSAYVSSSG